MLTYFTLRLLSPEFKCKKWKCSVENKEGTSKKCKKYYEILIIPILVEAGGKFTPF